MQGSTGEKDLNPPVENAIEYKYLSNTFVPLKNPVGEDIGDRILLESHMKNGSLIPDFTKTYIKYRKTDVCVIHAARGDSSISEWQKGTLRFETLINKIKGGISLLNQNAIDQKN